MFTLMTQEYENSTQEFRTIESVTFAHKMGENAWRELASITDGAGKVLTIQSKQFIASLRSAGVCSTES